MSNILKDSSRSKKRLFAKKISHRKIIIIIVLIIVILGSVAAYLIYSGFFNNKKSTTLDNTTSATVKSADLTTKATAVVSNSGYNAGQAYLDKVLDTSSSSNDKAAVYLSKASLASNNSSSTKDNSDMANAAVQYSIKADEISPSADTALAAASYSERQKNYETAIKYYKLYLSRTSDTVLGYEGYESHVKYLESKVNQ